MAFEIHEYGSFQEASWSLVENLAVLVQDEVCQKDSAHLAVSGGKSPIEFFQTFSRKKLPWSKVFLSLVDERLVPLKSEESNFNLVKTHLIQNEAQCAQCASLLDPMQDIDLLLQMSDAELEIKKLLVFANQIYKQPDIAILGMGLDGHTASLFPDSDNIEFALECDENIVYLAPKKAPYARLSMSLSAIEKCKKVFLLIQGEDKREVLERACLEPNRWLPVSYVLHSKKLNCEVYYAK